MIDGKTIRAAREYLGWSQEYLGKRSCEISQNAVSIVERGSAELLASTLRIELRKLVKASAQEPRFDDRAGTLLAKFQDDALDLTTDAERYAFKAKHTDARKAAA